jgi:hypothetical protein
LRHGSWISRQSLARVVENAAHLLIAIVKPLKWGGWHSAMLHSISV